ncbi:hypothetical protein [Acinetobacter boissieri]|uniref:Chemotaxis protein n=1 Tax=Acinetobacter boissieri TaxID=1219383 RepID=A0A1G6I0V3_9GAMM|nr:hypothetical protein [Acinetobacter boissieri]SDB99376.1 hypothetical protein SAMN05421733_107121 [Acinetobacter boissieri]
MADQTTVSFNPTSLLMVKSEIERSIQQIEILVTSLIEERKEPLELDDALLHLKQCAQVLLLLKQYNLSKVVEYSALLIIEMAKEPEHIKQRNAFVVSHALLSAKRYIDFSCLEEKSIPQFLLCDLNALEQQLHLPKTTEAAALEQVLDHIPEVAFDGEQITESSVYVHQLYKICLKQLFRQNTSTLNSHALKAVGEHLVHLSMNKPSSSYWKLVYQLFAHINDVFLNVTRLRIFVQIEKNIDNFLTKSNFKPSMSEVANIIYICLAQDSAVSEKLQEQLEYSGHIIADRDLSGLRKKLFSADYETVRTITQLLTEEITAIYQELEVKYQNLSTERLGVLHQQALAIKQILSVLNMHDIASDLEQYLPLLQNPTQIKQESLVNQLMQSLLSALNHLRLYARQKTPRLLRYKVVNQNIALDRLDDAYETLSQELQSLIDEGSNQLMQYVVTPEQNLIATLPTLLDEIAGAARFVFDNDSIYQAALNSARFIETCFEEQIIIKENDIKTLLSVYASIDIALKEMKNHQPIMLDMFTVALNNTQQLQAVA